MAAAAKALEKDDDDEVDDAELADVDDAWDEEAVDEAEDAAWTPVGRPLAGFSQIFDAAAVAGLDSESGDAVDELEDAADAEDPDDAVEADTLVEGCWPGVGAGTRSLKTAGD